MNQQIETAPLTKSEWKRFLRLQLSRGAQASAAIEGNPTTEEKAIVIALAKRAPAEYHDREIHNLHKLYDRATKGTFLGHGHPNIDCLCETNNKVLEQVIHPGGSAVPGMIRSHSVGAGPYLAPNHADCRELLLKFSNFFGNGNSFWRAHEQIHGRAEIAIVKAIVAHLYVAWIHPFGDGNGRTARLIEFMILCNANLSSAVGASLCRHYQQTRSTYYVELNRASKPRENWALAPNSFITYAVAGLQNALHESINEMLHEQREKYWLELLEESFPGRTNRAVRLKSLASYIADKNDNVSVPQIRAELHHGHSYRKLSYQTLARDLNTLISGGWIKRIAWGSYCGCKNEMTTRKSASFSDG